jgi:hypothetical protein
MSMVEVWREPSHFWRWRYLEPPRHGSDAVELVSNEVYDEREEAVEAAMTAYPGVTVRELETPPGTPAPSGRGGGAGSGGRLLVVLGLAAVVLAWRRARRRRRRR